MSYKLQHNRTSALRPRMKLLEQGERTVLKVVLEAPQNQNEQKQVRGGGRALYFSGGMLDRQGFPDLVSDALWTVYSKEHEEVSCKNFLLTASPAQIYLLCPQEHTNGFPFLYQNLKHYYSLSSLFSSSSSLLSLFVSLVIKHWVLDIAGKCSSTDLCPWSSTILIFQL